MSWTPQGGNGGNGKPIVIYYDSTVKDDAVKTNADRIRSMTDEELAEFEMQDGDCPPERMYPDSCPNCDRVTPKVCYDCWLDWLKREATNA